jgi:hypothetical protein
LPASTNMRCRCSVTFTASIGVMTRMLIMAPAPLAA